MDNFNYFLLLFEKMTDSGGRDFAILKEKLRGEEEFDEEYYHLPIFHFKSGDRGRFRSPWPGFSGNSDPPTTDRFRSRSR